MLLRPINAIQIFYSSFYIEESNLSKMASETVKKPATVKRGCDPSNEMTSNTAGRKEHMLDEVIMQMHYLAPNDYKAGFKKGF